jgi:hypothetical protein
MVRFITQKKLDQLLTQNYERGKREGISDDLIKTYKLFITKNENRKHTAYFESVTIPKGTTWIIDGDVFFIQMINNGGICNIRGNVYFPGKIISEEGSHVVFVNQDYLKDRVNNEG